MNFTYLLLAILPLAEPTYSGKCQIEGLGEVVFPSGEWTLERRVIDPTIDTFVFRRKGDRLERLSFQRIEPGFSGPIDRYFDSIGDSMHAGIPRRVLKTGAREIEVHDTTEVLIPVNSWLSKKGKSVCKGCSFLYTREEETADGANPPWMSHAFVCSVDDWVLIACHASPHVLSLEEVRILYHDSKFNMTLTRDN